MLNLGTGPRKLEPERGARHEDEGVDDHEVWEVFGIPMEGRLIAHLIDVAVLLEV